MDWQLAHLGQAGGTLTFERLVKGLFGLGAPDAAAVAGAERDFKEYAATFDGWLGTRKWLVGDRPTLADFAVGAVFQYAGPAGYPMASYANIAAWLGRLDAIPAWKATAPQM
jgi:glutathione S-transferase